CEAILHGGDIDKQEILDELKLIAPIYAVRGNNDGEWAGNIPESLSFELYGIKFYMIHNRKKMPKVIPEADIIIYGHSHKYEEKNEGCQLFLNPGSCGPKRFILPVTMAVLEITDSGSYNVKRIEIRQELDENGLPKNIKKIIKSVMRDTNRGIPVKEIAEINGISEKLAEQICRLYLTHPGVDADGIMTKMGI
ncbi:MAG: metallophosphatase family protein, partial [Lachnospiraceae bacterium]|nr:metallophosphatase family protein [Lachnospiraceae bacterium]